MSLSPIRFFCLSSFLLCVVACRTSPYQHLTLAASQEKCALVAKPVFSSVLYNANIDVVGKHLSGLLLFKQMPDSSIRVVFSNEMGLKFFDFEFQEKSFHVKYCMKQLNKKIVIKQLQKDLSLLLMHNIDFSSLKLFSHNNEKYHGYFCKKDESYYISDENCTQLVRIENAEKNKKKIIVTLNHEKGGMPDSVFIAHQTYNFTINLKQIER